MDLISVLLAFLGILVGAAPWVIPKAWYYFSTSKPTKRFWNPMFKQGGVSLITTAGKWQSPTLSQFCDFIAVIKAGTFFEKHFPGKYHLFTCEDNAPDVLTRNLILIAGPLSNSVTKHVLEKIKVRYTFKNHDIIDLSTGDYVRRSKIKDSNLPNSAEDYGIITKCVNPFNPNTRVIMAMGSHGWGTQAALEALFDPKNLNFLLAQNVDCYQLLISVAVHERHCGTAILETDSFVQIKG
jgi:hypothetical protein